VNKLIQLYENAHSNPTKGLDGVTSISFGGCNGEYLLSSGADSLIKVISFFFFF